MTTEECYARLGGDWAGVLGRLGSEERVARFLRMVPKDPSFQELTQALERGDGNAAFRCAHSIKGLALNLGLTPLAQTSAALTERLRSGGPEDGGFYPPLRDTYENTLAAIAAWEEGGSHV